MRTAAPDNEPPAAPSPLADLAPIPGDTYAVRAELKVLGAVWDKNDRIWRIPQDKLAQARALVEHQGLAPVAGGEIALETLADPFEQEGDGPRYVHLSEEDGNLYAARDALKAIGARWDKNNRAWKVREERAEYARAIVTSVTDDANETASDAPAVKPKRTAAPKPAPVVEAAKAPPKTVEAPPEPAAPVAYKADTPREKTAAKPVEAQAAAGPERAPEGETRPAEKPVARGGMMLGGLWRRRGADGKVYLSGYLSDTVEIRIISNDQRADQNDPSHRMLLIPVVPTFPDEE